MNILDTDIPVTCKPCKASVSKSETIDNIVGEWKAAGIVMETESPCESSALLIPKKDGEPRLVVVYCKLNAQTVRKVFPTPSIDEHLEALCGAKLFCTLDLVSGYLQVPLTETAKAKIAFIIPNETGQFECMVFGFECMVNAPYEFSRLIQRVLQPLQNKVAM